MKNQELIKKAEDLIRKSKNLLNNPIIIEAKKRGLVFNCVCCNKILIKQNPVQKYCSSCSIFNNQLRTNLSIKKTNIKKFKKERFKDKVNVLKLKEVWNEVINED